MITMKSIWMGDCVFHFFKPKSWMNPKKKVQYALLKYAHVWAIYAGKWSLSTLYYHVDKKCTRLGTRGGGGYFHMCAYWVCAMRETPIFSPEFLFQSIHILFSKITNKQQQKICFWAWSSFYILLVDFAILDTIIFKMSLISTRSLPPMAGSAQKHSAAPWVSQTCPSSSSESHFYTQNGSTRSGAPPPPPHFQAQNGPSSFRSPTFSRSTGSPFQSPCQFFTLPVAHTYQNLGWVPPPPWLTVRVKTFK